MPCPGQFYFSYSVDYIYDFCPLPDLDVGLSIFVCVVEHTSFHFGLCGRNPLSSGFIVSLPPTAAGAKFHSYRAYAVLQQWTGDTLAPTDWG